MKNIPSVQIKKGHDKRVKSGHLWLYSNEITLTAGEPENGDLVSVQLPDGNTFGIGFYNRNSLISLRLLSYSPFDSLGELFRSRLLSAQSLRERVFSGSKAYRMVFSESDLLPGLIIDRYNQTFVLQINSFGMEKNINVITDLLSTDFGAVNIFSKNDMNLRSMEGLPQIDTVYKGSALQEIITDGHLKFEINFQNSQKTGFFFDQVCNRQYMRKFCKNRRVFDGFCNSGGFGLHAMQAGARSVAFADASNEQLIQVSRNIAINELDPGSATVITGDIFESLEALHQAGEQFDVVMIDPPSFAKNKKNLFTALKGYEKLHRMALKILKDDGILATTSCSHHVSELEYQVLINRAAVGNKCNLQMLYKTGAAPDHPKHSGMDETAYLKFLVYRKTHLS